MPVLYKADDASPAIQTLIKALDSFEDKGELLVIGYVPENRDAQKHIADQEVVRGMAHSFMREGANLNIRHIDGTELNKEQAYVAENFIVQKNDERFANFKDYEGNEVDVTGAWAALIKIDDPKIRKLYKSGAWDGISLQGPAEVERDDEMIQKALDFYEQHHEGDDEMTNEELKKALEESNKALLTGLVEALKPKEEKKETKETVVAKADDAPEKEKPPVFKGDRTKVEDVRKHSQALQAYNLRKDVDWNDPKSIQTYEEALAKFQEENKEKEEGDEDEEEEVETPVLKKSVARSDAPTGTGPKGPKSKVPQGFQRLDLSKEDQSGFEVGDRMAAFINGKTK